MDKEVDNQYDLIVEDEKEDLDSLNQSKRGSASYQLESTLNHWLNSIKG